MLEETTKKRFSKVTTNKKLFGMLKIHCSPRLVEEISNQYVQCKLSSRPKVLFSWGIPVWPRVMSSLGTPSLRAAVDA